MSFISLSKREKYIFIATVGFIAVAILYNFIFEPVFKKWSALNNEITAKKTRLNKEIRLLQKADSIIQEYNTYAKSSKNISKILNYIENLSDSLGIKTSNIKPGSEVQKEFWKEYSIEVQIEGQFSDIIKFLSELIKLPCFVTVQKFDFRTVAEDSDVFKGTLILYKIVI